MLDHNGSGFWCILESCMSDDVEYGPLYLILIKKGKTNVLT